MRAGDEPARAAATPTVAIETVEGYPMNGLDCGHVEEARTCYRFLGCENCGMKTSFQRCPSKKSF